VRAHRFIEGRNTTELFHVMTTTESPDVLIDTNEAARRMGIAVATLHWWRWKGSPDQPLAVRVGKRGVRYRSSDIASWIASRQAKAKPPK
jgi:predicted DNA-binding transcriptional regulator AlpA